MLFGGSQIAPSTCLRTQLRTVFFRLNDNRAPARRVFSHSNRLREETTVQPERRRRVARAERGYVYRHIHRHGRIIGKPGRRQRQSSEQLATSSLGKPSEVIVLRDVLEDSKDGPAAGARPSGLVPHAQQAVPKAEPAKELQGAWTGQHLPADNEEINASIDELRPQSAVVDKHDWQQLEKQLLERYNLRQLVRYLVQSLGRNVQAEPGVAEDASSHKIHVTPWRPGRTSLEHRIGRVRLEKRELGKSKVSVTDQILRLAWRLTIDSEARELGELEVYVRRWQVSLLFDVKHDKKPLIESFIDSPLLARSANIRPYRQDNVVRITARKADAEEIARRLQRRLSLVHRDEIDLNVFKPLLGQSGWPDTLETLFTEGDLNFVSECTEAVFESNGEGKLGIYSTSESASISAHASGLLLSLLDLPSPTKRQHIGTTDDRHARTAPKVYKSRLLETRHVENPVMSAHRRHQSADWYRLIAPTPKPGKRRDGSAVKNVAGSSAPPGEVDWRKVTRNLGSTIQTLQLPARLAHDDNAINHAGWSSQGSYSDWTVSFGALLHTQSLMPSDTHSQRKTSAQFEKDLRTGPFLFLEQPKGLAPLLSNFMPVTRSSSSPQTANTKRVSSEGTLVGPRHHLLIYLTPSPFTQLGVEALRLLPRITMDLEDLGDRPAVAGLPGSQLTSVTATLARQELDVGFPDQIADLSFGRERAVTLDRSVWSNAGQLVATARKARTSLASPTGGLPASTKIDIDLPRSLLQSSLPQHYSNQLASEITTVTAQYYISHYQQVTTVDYVPLRDEARLARMDPDVKAMAEQWPESMVLRCSEVDGGAIGGRRTEAMLLRLPEENVGAAQSERTSGSTSTGVHRPLARKPGGGVLQLTETATTLLRLMTRANAGQLQSPYDASTQHALVTM